MIIFLNRDLFAGVRVANGLRARGDRVELVATAAAFASRLSAEGTVVRLGLIDMGAVDDWAPITSLAADGEDIAPILAFGPHRDVAAFQAAKDAGVTRVISNGAFHADPLGLVDRYARRG
ncbi:MAG: hypothetical protein WKF80_13335 [Thermomicrobiales bacterium]